MSQYAGDQVEVSISYVQDFAVDGLGVFLDDVAVTEDGTVTDETSFEPDFGGFTAGPPPPGSETTTQQAWDRTASLGLVVGPGVATADTMTLGFGFEGIGDIDTRAAVMGSAMSYLGLLDGPPPEGPGPEPGPGPGEPPAGETDTTAPQTEIVADPKKKTESAKAKFRFRSNEADSTFECKLDRDEWKSCDSPKRYRGLDAGKHKFKVRATDAAGNTDSSPAKYRWRVT